MNLDNFQSSQGPLSGIRVIEFAGLGPAPLCCMLLADLGATVLRVDRFDGPSAGQAMLDGKVDILQRGRLPVALDLKQEAGRIAALKLIESADILIEGFRPGVMERLGVGPDICFQHRPSLVYGRVTGWGQTGPLSHTAGHDINYLAISGLLHAIGRREGGPVPPLNMLADYAAGTMFLAFGVLAALLSSKTTGKGQVVDAAMTDGLAVMQTLIFTMRALGMWKDERQSNLLDGGAPRYDTYPCADGRYVAIGPLEPQFYKLLLQGLALENDPCMLKPDDPSRWPAQRQVLGSTLMTQTRDYWVKKFEGTDACLSPVLTPQEAMVHPHNVARSSFMEIDGVSQPGTAPRFSDTTVTHPAKLPPLDTNATSSLSSWGLSHLEINELIAAGIVR
jgi:alpha-methylacyl-CoA racemase